MGVRAKELAVGRPSPGEDTGFDCLSVRQHMVRNWALLDLVAPRSERGRAFRGVPACCQLGRRAGDWAKEVRRKFTYCNLTAEPESTHLHSPTTGRT